MTRRFFVEEIDDHGASIAIEGALAHRLSRVLRLRAGEEIVLFDGRGEDVRVRIEEANERRVAGMIAGREAGPAEPRVRVHLYQCITKGERFEWLIEKATELGVSVVTPMVCARSVVRTEGSGNRADRWRRIAVEAAEQCERSRVPEIGAPVRFEDAIANAPGIRLLPFERAHEATPNIGAALAASIDELFAANAVSLFIGPEGGYDDGEVAAATEAGVALATLGDRVLRSETAGLVALTLVMSAVGELG